METKALSYQALDTVPSDRTARRLDGNSRSKTRVSQIVGNRQYRHKAAAGLDFTMPENPLVLCRPQQAIVAGITCCRCSQESVVRQTDARALWLSAP